MAPLEKKVTKQTGLRKSLHFDKYPILFLMCDSEGNYFHGHLDLEDFLEPCRSSSKKHSCHTAPRYFLSSSKTSHKVEQPVAKQETTYESRIRHRFWVDKYNFTWNWWCVEIRTSKLSTMSGKLLPDNRTKRRKSIHRMPERCRIRVPVSKGNRGNKNKQTNICKCGY
jgi:hypothetical protein